VSAFFVRYKSLAGSPVVMLHDETGAPNWNRTNNGKLEISCYIHLTMEALGSGHTLIQSEQFDDNLHKASHIYLIRLLCNPKGVASK
jgi:hypothetical protein